MAEFMQEVKVKQDGDAAVVTNTSGNNHVDGHIQDQGLTIEMTEAMNTIVEKLTEKNESIMIKVGQTMQEKFEKFAMTLFRNMEQSDHNTVDKTVGHDTRVCGEKIPPKNSHNVDYSAGTEDDSLSLAAPSVHVSEASRCKWIGHFKVFARWSTEGRWP